MTAEIRNMPPKPKRPGNLDRHVKKPEQDIVKYFYPAFNEDGTWDMWDWDEIKDKEDDYMIQDSLNYSFLISWVTNKGFDINTVEIVSFIENDDNSGIGVCVSYKKDEEIFAKEMKEYRDAKRKLAEELVEFKMKEKQYEIALAEWNLWKAQKDLLKVTGRQTLANDLPGNY